MGEGTGRPLAGMVALVTGAGRGIGARTAGTLAAAGAAVVVTSRSADELDAVVEGIRSGGNEARAVPGDITDEAFVEELFHWVREDHSRLDILVNSAGIAPFAPMAEVPPEQLQNVLRLNTVAPYACMRQAISLMESAGGRGHIVNIGSVEGHWPTYGESGAYPSSKFALRALTMTTSKELKQRRSGIHVSMVSPGGVDTTLVTGTGASQADLLEPEAVARSVLHIVTAPPDVHVFEVIVVPAGRVYW